MPGLLPAKSAAAPPIFRPLIRKADRRPVPARSRCAHHGGPAQRARRHSKSDALLQASYSPLYPGAQSPGAVLLPVGGSLLAITIAVALFRRRATSLALLLTARYRDTRGDAWPSLRKAAGH